MKIVSVASLNIAGAQYQTLNEKHAQNKESDFDKIVPQNFYLNWNQIRSHAIEKLSLKNM